jgi:hypothetical protein
MNGLQRQHRGGILGGGISESPARIEALPKQRFLVTGGPFPARGYASF